jgi:hypothetical protein
MMYVLHHVHKFSDDEDDEDVKLVGVYSSNESALSAIERLKNQPGFCDYPLGFCIDAYKVDEDNWREGFINCPGDDPPN